MFRGLAIEYGLKFERQIDVRVFCRDHAFKPCGCHADNRGIVIGHNNVVPDDGRTGTITLSPEAITDDSS